MTGAYLLVERVTEVAVIETTADGVEEPTHLMERVSKWLQAHPGEHSLSAITKAVTGKDAALRRAHPAAG